MIAERSGCSVLGGGVTCDPGGHFTWSHIYKLASHHYTQFLTCCAHTTLPQQSTSCARLLIACFLMQLVVEAKPDVNLILTGASDWGNSTGSGGGGISPASLPYAKPTDRSRELEGEVLDK